MLRWIALLALLSSCGKKAPPPAAEGAPSDAGGREAPAAPARREPSKDQRRFPEVVLPLGEGAEEPPEKAFVITLTAEGRVLAEDLDATLETLSEALRERAASHAWRDLPTGVRVSTMPVVFRADARAPWQHAQWILTMCAEQKVYRTWFAVRAPDDAPEPTSALGGALRSFLPTDKGISPSPKPPEETFVVETLIRSTAFEEREWAPDGRKVPVPTAFRYHFGEEQTESKTELKKWIREELEAAEAEGIAASRVSGCIKAWSTVPTGAIVEVLSMYVTTSYARTDFYGTAIPFREVRKSETLPYPTGKEPR